MACGGVEVGECDGVHPAGDLDGIAQRDGVEVTGPECALPLVVAVVRLGQVERGVFGDERPGPVRLNTSGVRLDRHDDA